MQVSKRKRGISCKEREMGKTRSNSKFPPQIHRGTLVLERHFQKHNLSTMTFIGQSGLPGEFDRLLLYTGSAKRKSRSACFDLAASFREGFLSLAATTLRLTCYLSGPVPGRRRSTAAGLCFPGPPPGFQPQPRSVVWNHLGRSRDRKRLGFPGLSLDRGDKSWWLKSQQPESLQPPW